MLCLCQVNTKEALQKVQQLRLYKYQYSQDYAESAGIEDNQRTDTGVIAQEMMEVLPDAVQETGDVILPNGQRIENFLVVRKVRQDICIICKILLLISLPEIFLTRLTFLLKNFFFFKVVRLIISLYVFSS